MAFAWVAGLQEGHAAPSGRRRALHTQAKQWAVQAVPDFPPIKEGSEGVFMQESDECVREHVISSVKSLYCDDEPGPVCPATRRPRVWTHHGPVQDG